MKRNARFFIGLIALTISGSAWALPSAENYNTFFKAGDSPQSQQDDPLFFADHDDPNVYYAPYDAIYVKPKDDAEGEPMFGMTYDEQGGMLSFTVRAGYSEARRAVIQRYIEDEKEVKPLAPISGGWALTLNHNNTEIFLGAPNEVQTVLPDVPIAMSVVLSEKAVRYIVMGYQTGASLGVNYSYTFRAVLTPFRLRASIHWQNFHNFVQNETKIATHWEMATQARSCVFLSFGCFTVRGKTAVSSRVQIRNVVKRAWERNIVRIWHRGGGGNQTQEEVQKRLLDEITKIVISKTFKPLPSRWEAMDIGDADANCSAELEGTGISTCLSIATAFLHNSETQFEDRAYIYDVTSEGIVNLPAAVGSSFSYMCRDYPETFIHVLTGQKGCPTVWNADGIKTEEEPDAPAAVLPEPSESSQPEVSMGGLLDNW